MAGQAQPRVRRRLRVRGTVQGVGFRPYVYKLATELGLTGYVLNDPDGVLIEIEGAETAAEAFGARLTASPPPLSSVTAVESQDVRPAGDSVFEIRASGSKGEITAPISPDAATCQECIAEIFDPEQRRYRYPFTNCTNCGPRFTIATAIPYDRANTTMRAFTMCEECRTEYEDPTDRRFHAQPIACPRCGPSLRLIDADGVELGGDPIAAAATLLQEGRIVAVKGLGGYHLACDARSEAAVIRLRQRKAREEKPLAVMAPDLSSARCLVQLNAEAEALLRSHRAPIVLLPRAPGSAQLAEAVAPGNRYLGVMVPYTPLHHLLAAGFGAPMVLTSGNVSEEPMVHGDREALLRLKGIADAFLVHDRPVHMRCDDSVVRAEGRSFPIRRARGYAPSPLRMARGFTRAVLAAGPELKHTFCLGLGDRAILSHHIGDLENFETMEAFTSAVEHLTRIYSIRPEVVAYDLHPEYLATKWALGLDIERKVGVQHHHAHIASCLADNDRAGPVIGVAVDGTGFGTDGTIWGCEVLACEASAYERLFHLREVPLPGSSAAIREPWRMGAVYLEAAWGDAARALGLPFVKDTSERWGPVLQMARKEINSPRASSGGRLFDAAAALCGLRRRVTYEGQAAIELEQAADPSVQGGYDCSIRGDEIDGVELVAALVTDLLEGAAVPEAAARFHNGFADALLRACLAARELYALNEVALSGGTFQNMLLLRRLTERLSSAGFEVLVHRRVPPNDGGISLGQAVIANAITAADG